MNKYALVIGLITIIVYPTHVGGMGYFWNNYYAETISIEPVNISLSTGKTARRGFIDKEVVFEPHPDSEGTHISFSIPKAYMTFSPNWKGGKQQFITLIAVLPDMAAKTIVQKKLQDEASISKLSLREIRKMIFLNQIRMMLQIGSNDHYQFNVKKALSSAIVIGEEKSHLLPMKLQDAHRYGLGAVVWKDDVLYVNKDRTYYYICNKPRPEKNYDGVCQTTIYHDDRISVQYAISRTQLANWKAIDKKIHIFIDSLKK